MARRAAPPAALPDGSRDVLAVEARELTGIETALAEVFAGFGYREVRTPVLELADVLDRAQEGGIGDAFRLFDDHGRVLVLRPDLTIPATRLIATRMVDHPGPVRVSYLSRAFRPPPAGRARAAEQLQAGIELVGAGGPPADAEALAVLVAGLRATGLDDFRVGIGDVSLTTAVLDGAGVAAAARPGLEDALLARNLVAWRERARASVPPGAAGTLVVELPTLRGGAELLDRIDAVVPAAAPACARLRRTLELAGAHGAGDALMLDLGGPRAQPYYSGLVVEAYAPGVAAPVAMGGRYDGLGDRFGRSRPAVGFAIALDLLHRALGDRAQIAPGRGTVLAGGLESDLAEAAAARRAGVTVVTAPASEGEALARADGWRLVARRAGDGFEVRDLDSGATHRGASLLEAVTAFRT